MGSGRGGSAVEKCRGSAATTSGLWCCSETVGVHGAFAAQGQRQAGVYVVGCCEPSRLAGTRLPG